MEENQKGKAHQMQSSLKDLSMANLAGLKQKKKKPKTSYS